MKRYVESSTTLDLKGNRSEVKSKFQIRFEAEKRLPTLTKADIARKFSERIGINKREASDIVEKIFNEICSALEHGEVVKLPGFGSFQVLDKLQRPGRNPKTAKKTVISARRVVTFQASQKLKRMTESKILSPINPKLLNTTTTVPNS